MLNNKLFEEKLNWLLVIWCIFTIFAPNFSVHINEN